MSGRGDNNKAGSSGRGASNQSNQGFNKASDQGKMNHGEQTGGNLSQPQKASKDTSSDRNQGSKKENA